MTGPKRAMILAAGRGERMRPLTDRIPKPVIPIAGRSTLDRMLDRFAGFERVVVNACHLAGKVEAAVAGRRNPPVVVSREERFLGTGGGVANALDLLGDGPFVVANGDVFLTEPERSVLATLATAWDPDRMDALLLLVPTERADGYRYAGDFFLTGDNRLKRRGDEERAPFVYASLQIVHSGLFDGAPDGAFSFNVLWDRAIGRNRACGVVHDGAWFTVDAVRNLSEAEAWIIRNEPHSSPGP